MSKRQTEKKAHHNPKPQSQNEFSKAIDSQSELNSQALITLKADEIDTYDKNPRRAQNPQFAAIKQSILNNGMNQPLVVTKRPGSSRYMVYKGGNTRLAALRELYTETQQKKFNLVQCSFQPWSGFESDAIIGHLQENQIRKSLCFLDRAYGVKIALEYLSKEAGRLLSLRESLPLIVRKGFPVTLSTLSIMSYAVNAIEPFLNYEIAINMSRRHFQNLRRLENCYSSLCEELGIPKLDRKILFRRTLKIYNEQMWSLDTFRRSLESIVAHDQSKSVQDIALRLENYLNVSSLPLSDKPEDNSIKILQENDIQWPDQPRSKMVHEGGVYQVNTPKNGSFVHQNGARKGKQGLKENSQFVPKLSQKRPDRHQSVIPDLTVECSIPNESEPLVQIRSLQQQAYSIAWSVAKRHEFLSADKSMSPVVAKTENWGIGYLICDFPIPLKNISATHSGMRDALWWVLLELCDLQWAVSCSRPTVENIVEHSSLQVYVKSGNAKTLYLLAKDKMKCIYPHLGLVTFCLRLLDEESWNDIERLAHVYRSLHHLARKNNIDLFQHPK